MMRRYDKKAFPVDGIRRYLEPGPVVLLSTAWKGKNNVMTLGWHTVMEFNPSLVGCMITASNHSFGMIRQSRACVINIPTEDMARTVLGIGSCSGADTDKFSRFGLTAAAGAVVKAPLIEECWASFECRLADSVLVNKYNFFIFEVVRAWVASTTRYPRTLHYRGDGLFMTSGKHIRFPFKG